MAKPVRAERADLKPAQRKVLGALEGGDARDLTRARYQEITGVSRSQAAYDLADLVDAGLLVRVGAGRSTRYRLARGSHSARRRWTSDRIRSELSAFCSGRTTWPSTAEFKRAGRSDLYVAASRYGGIGFWARELGLSRSDDTAVAGRKGIRLGRRARPAVAAALVALAAATAGFALRGREHASPVTRSTSANESRGNRVVPLADEVQWLRAARVAGRATQAAASMEAARSRTTLVLRASRGDSWISVRSATGRLLYERTLGRGTQARLQGTALWIRLGAAANVDVSTNGSRPHPLPERAASIVVSARGIRVTEWTPERSAPQLVTSEVHRSPVTAVAAASPSATRTTATPAAPSSGRSNASSWPAPLPSPSSSSTPKPLPTR